MLRTPVLLSEASLAHDVSVCLEKFVSSCPPRQKSTSERLKAKVQPLLNQVTVEESVLGKRFYSYTSILDDILPKEGSP